MQFSIVAFVVALAATASAVTVPANGTTPVYPSGTGAATSTGGLRPTSTSSTPFDGAASVNTGSALGLIVAAGVALMI